MNAACFKTKWRRVQAELADAGVELAPGREVRLQGMVTVWDNGRVFLEVSTVDVAALVGRRAAERERLLRVLAAEGLLERNGQRPLALVPLRVGLIGSRQSDGHRDFVGVLDRSAYAFVVNFVHAPVQGPGAGKALADALEAVGRDHKLDVVCLVRGGGAELDAFDAEPLARAIAASTVPVFTGIGHTADRSVADVAAHSACPTPTACAAQLVARVASFHAALAECGARLAGAGVAHLNRHHDAVLRASAILARAGRREVDASVLELTRKATRLRPDYIEERLEARSARLSDCAARLFTGSRRVLAEAERNHAAQRLQLRAHAPARVLARGYSLTRDAAGRLVTDAATLAAGDTVVTAFAAGSARATVTAVTDPASIPEEEQ
jgi:exodeoxyribonuclease VII large subunit